MEIGEDKYEVGCDLCGAIGNEIVHVDMYYSPNPELSAEFVVFLCKDCLFEWMGASFQLPN
jgi:hypothetical protein